MRLSIVEGIVAMPIVFMTLPGNFLVASLATEHLSVGESVYGMLASLPAWCNILQLFVMPYLAQKTSQKSICLGFSWLHLLSWTALCVALPHLPRDGSWPAIAFLIAVFALSSLSFALVNISWTLWIQEWLPSKSRGKYLGRRNRILQGSTVLFLLAVSQSIKAFAESAPIVGFQWIIGISVALRGISIYLQQSIYSGSDAATETPGDLRSKLAFIVSHKSLLRFIFFGAAFGFTANLFGPFFSIFLYKALAMTASEVGNLVMLSTISGAVSMPAWGRFSDRHGCRPTLVLSLSCWMIVGYLFFWSSPERHWIVYLIFALGGIFGAGFMFGLFAMLLKLVPKEAKTASISLNMAASSLAGALSPIIGGYIIEWAEHRYGDFLAVFKTLAAVHHSLILCTVVILVGIREPQSSTLVQAVGSMRAFRQAGALLGLSFLVNYSFFKRRPK